MSPFSKVQSSHISTYHRYPLNYQNIPKYVLGFIAKVSSFMWDTWGTQQCKQSLGILKPFLPRGLMCCESKASSGGHFTVYPKKYAHGFCFAVLCCGYTLTDFPISIRLTSLALWQSNDCPTASKATLMNMDKYFMWIHYERLHNHNKAKHNKTVCIFLGIGNVITSVVLLGIDYFSMC